LATFQKDRSWQQLQKLHPYWLLYYLFQPIFSFLDLMAGTETIADTIAVISSVIQFLNNTIFLLIYFMPVVSATGILIF
jgi:hypothetical protein